MQLGQQGRVAGQNAQITHLAVRNQGADATGKDRLLHADDVAMQTVRHNIHLWRTSGRLKPPDAGSPAGLQFLGLLDGFFNAADHVERLFGHMVVFTGKNALEAANGFLQRHVLAR